HVAQQHQPVDAVERVEQRRADLRPAQEVGPPQLTEVQVGDEGDRHRCYAGSAKRARRTFLSNFPTEVLGTSSMNSTRSGSHHLATRSERNSRTASSSRSQPSFLTTQAQGRSLHFSSGMAIT